MSGDVRLEMSLEVAKAIAGLESVIRAEARHEAGLQKTVAASKSVAAATKEMAEQAKSLDQIRAAMAAGDERRLKTRLAALEQEAQAQSKLRALEAQRMGDLGRARYAERETRLQESRYHDRLAEGIQRSLIDMRQLPAATAEQVRAAQGLPEPIEAAAEHADRLGASLAAVAGMLTAGAMAAGTLRQGLAAAQLEADTAAGEVQRMRQPDRALAEMARGATPEERARDLGMMRVTADALAAEHGIPREDARQLIFESRGLGYESEVATIARASRLAGGTPELARLIRAGKTAFPDEQLGATEILNMAATAAKASGPLELRDLAAGMPLAGAFAKQAGSDAAETMAGLSVLADVFPSGEIAAQRMMYLAGEVAEHEELRGGGVLAGVEKILAMPEDERKKMVGGRRELGQTLGFLEDPALRQRWRERQKMIEGARQAAGRPGSELELGIRATEVDPNLKATREQAGAEVKKAVAVESEGLKELRRKASIDRVLAEDAAAGGSRIKRGFVTSLYSFGKALYPVEAPEEEGLALRKFSEYMLMPLRDPRYYGPQPGSYRPYQPGKGVIEAGLDRVDPQMEEQTQVLREVRDGINGLGAGSRQGAAQAEAALPMQ
jgi:hypothetical protein